MKIVKVIGGLGNQMFQLALYEALRRQFPAERVLLDLHTFKGYNKHRGFEAAKVFGISYQEATLAEVARIAYPYPNFLAWRIGSRLLPARKTMLCEKSNFALEPEALKRYGDTYYDGYWQHEDYFKHIRQELLELFKFPAFTDERNLAIAQEIKATASCSIHIRRGDYLTDPLRKGTTGLEYVEAAIAKMKASAKPERWFVFSDDMAWTQAHLSEWLTDEQTCYVDWNQAEHSIADMHLMSLCQHQIIANSSFSWWGAWLCTRENQTVIAPSKWMNMKDVCSPVPKRWKKI